MKLSAVLAVSALAVAFCTTGCRYDKAKKGAADEGTGPMDISGQVDGSAGLQEGNIDGFGERRFEDYCEKCTDVEFAPVYFAFNATVVPANETTKLDAVAQHLQSNPNRVVVVAGHCDERGSNEYNLELGDNRASVARNYLQQSGIAADRIQTRSFGEEQPAAMGSDESAWQLNRRDEFGIYLRK